MARISKMAAFCIILADTIDYANYCKIPLQHHKRWVEDKMKDIRISCNTPVGTYTLLNGDDITYHNGRWHYVSYTI